MKKNVGSLDKAIRVLLALLVGVLYFTGAIEGTIAIVLLVLAGIFILTSVISFCPLYLPFGISTCPQKHHHAPPQQHSNHHKKHRK
ncbi:MAG: DUF2892 domain-containing protein [Sediminibacterium sp.]|nr:DUF2892 domain-containing protein [Sediminibacterium sp.]